MCMTAADASLSKTAAGCFELADGRHLTIYENTAANRNTNGGNAMLLAAPADGPIDFVDFSACPHVLKDMRKALPAPRAGKSLSFGADDRGSDDEVAVSQCGIYTCLAAPPNASAAAIRAAIAKKVPAGKRPTLTDDYIERVRAAYRPSGDFTLIIACFSNEDAIEAHPLAYAYVPTDGTRLFFPGLDDHTGNGPRQGTVQRDHLLIAGSHQKTGGAEVAYTDAIPETLRGLLPTHVAGDFINGDRPNSDWVLPVDVARSERIQVSCKRVVPAGLSA